MKYRVVVTTMTEKYLPDAIEKVEQEVNRLIMEGYEPLGGISLTVVEAGYSSLYNAAQAMIKK